MSRDDTHPVVGGSARGDASRGGGGGGDDALAALRAGTLQHLPDWLQCKLFPPSVLSEDVLRGGTHGDGTCFFHSVAYATNVDGYVGSNLPRRQQIGQKFRCDFQASMSQKTWDSIANKNPENLNRSFDDVKASFCVASEWAEESMIKYTSIHLGLNVIFVDLSGRSFYCKVHGDPKTQPSVIVLWVNRVHFEPVLLVRRRCDDHLHVSGTLDPKNPADAAVITHVCDQFTQACGPMG